MHVLNITSLEKLATIQTGMALNSDADAADLDANYRREAQNEDRVSSIGAALISG